MLAFIRAEWFLAVAAATSLAFLLPQTGLPGDLTNPIRLALVFAWLFAAVLGSALAVVRHADHLAVRMGEPFGTLILTLSVTFIEVISISAVMVHGELHATLARDTLFSVVMIILNLMVGLSLLIGGWRHREQTYNLQGANTYLGVIIPLVVLSLVLPTYTQTTPGPTLSPAQQIFLVIMSVGLYGAFLRIQTGRHRDYFALDEDDADPAEPRSAAGAYAFHAILLLAYMAPVAVLAEHLAVPLNYVVATSHMPLQFGGVIIAILVATPEAVGAVRAALANRLQRSINIALGSVLSTISLTVPAMVLLSRFMGLDIVLGVQNTDTVLLLLTLAVSVVTFASGRTNVMQGLVHLILFVVYLLLIVEG
jgi:Ca2+:H+ antiporter